LGRSCPGSHRRRMSIRSEVARPRCGIKFRIAAQICVSSPTRLIVSPRSMMIRLALRWRVRDSGRRRLRQRRPDGAGGQWAPSCCDRRLVDDAVGPRQMPPATTVLATSLLYRADGSCRRALSTLDVCIGAIPGRWPHVVPRVPISTTKVSTSANILAASALAGYAFTRTRSKFRLRVARDAGGSVRSTSVSPPPPARTRLWRLTRKVASAASVRRNRLILSGQQDESRVVHFSGLLPSGDGALCRRITRPHKFAHDAQGLGPCVRP